MNKQIRFLTGSHIIFEDDENPGNFYSPSQEEMDRKNIILAQFNTLYERDIPSEYTIEVLPLGRVKEGQYEDEYDIISKTHLDFPINRIKWIFIRLEDKP